MPSMMITTWTSRSGGYGEEDATECFIKEVLTEYQNACSPKKLKQPIQFPACAEDFKFEIVIIPPRVLIMDALLLCWPLRIFFELKQQFHKMWSNTNILSRLCSTYGRYIILKLIDTWNSNDIDILRCYQINPSVPRFSRLTQLACHKQDKMKWNLSS